MGLHSLRLGSQGAGGVRWIALPRHLGETHRAPAGDGVDGVVIGGGLAAGDEVLLELELELLKVDGGLANGAEEDEVAPVLVEEAEEKGPQDVNRT